MSELYNAQERMRTSEGLPGDKDMRPPRPNAPPATRNPEASKLIGRALQSCRGCRTSWRLYKGQHRGGITCNASVERQTLREIAAQRKS